MKECIVSLKYYTINLFRLNLTELIEVTSINYDGTINTPTDDKLMTLETLESIGYSTQKEAEREAAKNFLKCIHLFREEIYFKRVSELIRERYPDLLI